MLGGAFLLFSLSAYGQEVPSPASSSADPQPSKPIYHAHLDLRNVSRDRLRVRLLVPTPQESSITFIMPKIVPGMYSISNFGRFVEKLRAQDKKGRKLSVKQIDTNRWEISKAQRLHEISYYIHDTFDDKSENFIFQPGGSSIEAQEVFVLNTFAMFGYLAEYKNLPYRLSITHNGSLYGTTAMPLLDIANKEDTQIDTYQAKDYFEFTDNPLLYAAPDTAGFQVANTRVLVGTFSRNKKLQASKISNALKETLQAQAEYLGGNLPVDKYAFLVYAEPVSGSYGALEHSSSSLYYLPEPTSAAEARASEKTIRDIAAHEFFHILTPLTIHSEEIGDFDFIDPKMSKHLWLYEGVTEYFAHHAQLCAELKSPKEFIQEMQDKINTMIGSYNDTLPFTKMSKNVLTTYENQYGNVYQKGALIAFMLDILIRKYSQGEKGLIDLMNLLSSIYGKNNSFKDDALFTNITTLTDPKIKDFFAAYVAGPVPLPLKTTLALIGIDYEEGLNESVVVADNAVLEEADLVMATRVPYKNRDRHLLVIRRTKKNASGVFRADASGFLSLGDLKMDNYNEVLGFLNDFHTRYQVGDTLAYTGLVAESTGMKHVSGSFVLSEGYAVGKSTLAWKDEDDINDLDAKALRQAWLGKAPASKVTSPTTPTTPTSKEEESPKKGG